jgi:hypothetical protein
MPSLQTIALFMGTALALNLTPNQRACSSCPAVWVRGALRLSYPSLGWLLRRLFTHSQRHSVYQPCFRIRQLHSTSKKYCGATYLVYLGISGFMKGGVAGAIAGIDKRSRTTPVKIYWQGFLTDLLNSDCFLTAQLSSIQCCAPLSYTSFNAQAASKTGLFPRCDFLGLTAMLLEEVPREDAGHSVTRSECRNPFE